MLVKLVQNTHIYGYIDFSVSIRGRISALFSDCYTIELQTTRWGIAFDAKYYYICAQNVLQGKKERIAVYKRIREIWNF